MSAPVFLRKRESRVAGDGLRDLGLLLSQEHEANAGAEVVARARAALGARFRLHGRCPNDGLDCVGLAAWALGIGDLPSGYALRSGDQDAVAGMIARAGLRRVTARRAGDLLLARAGPGQLHLAIWTGAGVIHADAMLRRVVERPGDPPWPVVGVWRTATWPR